MLIIGLSVLVWQYGLFNIKQLLLELLKKIEVIFYFNKTYSFILCLFSSETSISFPFLKVFTFEYPWISLGNRQRISWLIRSEKTYVCSWSRTWRWSRYRDKRVYNSLRCSLSFRFDLLVSTRSSASTMWKQTTRVMMTKIVIQVFTDHLKWNFETSFSKFFDNLITNFRLISSCYLHFFCPIICSLISIFFFFTFHRPTFFWCQREIHTELVYLKRTNSIRYSFTWNEYFSFNVFI